MKIYSLVAVTSCMLAARLGMAASVTYAVDPARSVLYLTGTYAGASLQPTASTFFGIPGPTNGFDSLTAFYQGTIAAERDSSANTLRITGGSVLAQDNGVFIPPTSTAIPANYGAILNPYSNGVPLPGASTSFNTAVRTFAFSLHSPVIGSSSNFDASQISGTITSGSLDFALITTNPSLGTTSEIDGTTSLGGDLNLASGAASLTTVDGVETLTIPFSADLLSTQASGEPLYLQLSGTIVGTSAVPDPGIAALPIAVSLLFLMRCSRRTQPP